MSRPNSHRRASLRVRLDVGRAHHAAHVEHHEVDEARGLDVVALLVREDRGRGVGEERADLVVARHALGDTLEGRERVVARGAKEPGQRGGRVTRDGREAQEVRHRGSCP